MTKSELTAKVAQLEETLRANESSQIELTNRLLEAKRELEDVNKPVITKQTASDIQDIIEYTLENYDFNNPEEYEYDFNIGYDNRIELENIGFNNINEVCELIFTEVESLFKIEENKEDND